MIYIYMGVTEQYLSIAHRNIYINNKKKSFLHKKMHFLTNVYVWIEYKPYIYIHVLYIYIPNSAADMRAMCVCIIYAFY